MTDIKDKLDQVTKIGQEIDRGKPSADELLREARDKQMLGIIASHVERIGREKDVEGWADLLEYAEYLRGLSSRIDAHLASQPASQPDSVAVPVRVKEEWEQLIFAVARKHPNETRFQTALRYINEAESGGNDQCGAKEPK